MVETNFHVTESGMAPMMRTAAQYRKLAQLMRTADAKMRPDVMLRRLLLARHVDNLVKIAERRERGSAKK
jgi:hypothetical protein